MPDTGERRKEQLAILNVHGTHTYWNGSLALCFVPPIFGLAKTILVFIKLLSSVGNVFVHVDIPIHSSHPTSSVCVIHEPSSPPHPTPSQHYLRLLL